MQIPLLAKECRKVTTPPRFIFPNAKSAARAVSAMKVSDEFTHAIEVMKLPSVTKTFFDWRMITAKGERGRLWICV